MTVLVSAFELLDVLEYGTAGLAHFFFVGSWPCYICYPQSQGQLDNAGTGHASTP